MRLLNFVWATLEGGLDSAGLPKSDFLAAGFVGFLVGIGGGTSTGGVASAKLLRRNRPVGERDRILKREDLGDSGVGDDARIDFLSVEGGGDAAAGGEMDRTAAGVARIVGAAPPERIEVRIVNPPPLLLRARRFRRSRWKLLTEASESLS